MYTKVFLIYFENAARLLYGVILLFIIRSILGDEDFASLAFSISVALMLYSLSKYSLDSFVLRKLILLTSDREKKSLLLESVFYRVLISLILTLLVLFTYYIFDKDLGLSFFIVLIQIVRPMDCAEWQLRSIEKITSLVAIRLISLVVPAAIILLIFFLDYFVDLSIVVLILVFEWLISSAFYIVVLRRNGVFSKEIFQTIDFTLIKSVVVEATPAFIAFFLYTIYSKIDQIYLKELLTPSDYSDYMLAARLNDTSLMLVGTITLLIYPRLVRLHSRDSVSFNNKIRKFSWYYLAGGGVLISSIWLLRYNYEIIQILLLGEYVSKNMINILSFLSLSMIFNFLLALRSSYFVLTEASVNVLLGNCIGAIISFFCGIPLMYIYGDIGGAISLVLSSIGALFISNFLTKEGRRFLRIIF